MASQEDIDQWQSNWVAAATDFALRCKRLRDTNPLGRAVLEDVMPFLMTELWDNGFSQTEIRTAFQMAIDGLPDYGAGEERRGDRR
jgi:hypothetical protein